MIKLFRQLKCLFNRRERWQLILLSGALVVRAGVELLGLGSIAPFMGVVADPTVVERNQWLRAAYEYFGFASLPAFLTALGILVIITLTLSNAVGAVTNWATFRFSWGMHHRLSSRLLKAYLSQPYSFFTERNSASLNKTILSEAQSVIIGVVLPALNVFARSLVIIALVGFLIFLNPVLAVATVTVLGGGYGVFYALVKAKQRRLGRERVTANEQRFKVIGETFGGIKDVKVLQREDCFSARFGAPSWTYSKVMASNAAISQLPRYVFDTLIFGGFILVVLFYLRRGSNIAEILPLVSLYAFAGYRLMPELNQVLAGLAAIRFNQGALDDLIDDLRVQPIPSSDVKIPDTALPFEREIRVDSVRFSYAVESSPAVKDLSLTIPRNKSIGLVGASGSGKTTLVDLLLGLYKPDDGTILIDGVPLTAATIPAWRRQVGYVPQHIFLCDDSIAHNIAFGVPPGEVDMARVERAARVAHLHDFIETLSNGYQTVVGERGVRLSGGQRQRIGIARALYHDPAVLVMDEATSALDGATEGFVMDAIRELAGQKTLILIAHRLTTLDHCDCIYMLQQGRLVDEGTYHELVTKSTPFRAMAKLEAAGEGSS